MKQLSDYIYHETERGVLYCGDCLEIIKQLPDESIDTCITSPPYWGLRDYGTAEWIGGSAECDHKGEPMRTKAYVNQNCGTGDDVKNKENCQFYKDTCPKCGAVRKDQQLGLEKTPEQYVANMVNLFREVRRVLKRDGVLWLNLGDSYNGSGGAGGDYNKGGLKAGQPKYKGRNIKTLKPKDLVGIPWRTAFALQADGWYLRQDIIWHKPNPMPESVTDRCTKSHEYIFLLTKSAKYYYDHIAIQEPANYDGRNKTTNDGSPKYQEMESPKGPQTSYSVPIERWQENANGEKVRNKRSVWTVTTKPFKEAHFATFPPDLILPCVLTTPKEVCSKCGKPYQRVKIHSKQSETDKTKSETTKLNDKPYAVAEREGIIAYRNTPPQPIIAEYLNSARKQAGLSVDYVEGYFGGYKAHHWFENGGALPDINDWIKLKELIDFDDKYDAVMTQLFEKPAEKMTAQYKTIGWQPTCHCNAETQPAVILDPFFGSGTTGMVAVQNGRKYVGIDLNEKYCEIAKRRIETALDQTEIEL